MPRSSYLPVAAGIVVAILVATVVFLAAQYSAQQRVVARISSNNLAFVGSSAVIEMLRLRYAFATRDVDELRLRADIFESRVGILASGEFKRFADTQPGGAAVVADAVTLAHLVKLSLSIDDTDVPSVKAGMTALERPLLALASRSNQYASEEVAAKRALLHRMFEFMAAVTATVALVGLGLFLATVRSHRLLGRRNEELRVARDQFETLALSDHLTGIANRARFTFELERSTSATIALVDLDYFKSVNDQHGHGTGDEVLVEVARRLCHTTDGLAIVARLGGDEFALLACCEPSDFHRAVANAVRHLHLPFETRYGLVRIGASAGIATAGDDDTPTSLMSRADAALYRSKMGGRGRVSVCETTDWQATDMSSAA